MRRFFLTIAAFKVATLSPAVTVTPYWRTVLLPYNDTHERVNGSRLMQSPASFSEAWFSLPELPKLEPLR